MIKNIEDLKNIQIVCRNQEQVKDCLNYLKQLGFDVEDFTEYYDGCHIVFWGYRSEEFLFNDRFKSDLSIDFYNKKFIKTLQKLIKEKEKGKEQEAKTIVEYLRSKPIEVRIDNRQDYDNIINYFEEQGVLWNNGKKLSESVGYNNKIIKFLTFWGNIYGKDKLETGIMWSMELDKIRKNISVKELFKKFNIEYKESPDFEVAEDGRITKINNRESKKNIYFLDNYNKEYFFSNKENVDYCIDCGLVFETEQARDKAMFKSKIETKLKNIAEMLNNGRKIYWKNSLQEKFFIYYDYDDEELDCDFRLTLKVQGTIYCLDKNFLEVAKQEIGEENLIKYFKE